MKNCSRTCKKPSKADAIQPKRIVPGEYPQIARAGARLLHSALARFLEDGRDLRMATSPEEQDYFDRRGALARPGYRRMYRRLPVD